MHDAEPPGERPVVLKKLAHSPELPVMLLQMHSNPRFLLRLSWEGSRAACRSSLLSQGDRSAQSLAIVIAQSDSALGQPCDGGDHTRSGARTLDLGPLTELGRRLLDLFTAWCRRAAEAWGSRIASWQLTNEG